MTGRPGGTTARREDASGRRQSSPRPGPEGTPRWGSVARRGAAEVHRREHPDRSSAAEVWRREAADAGGRDSWAPEEVWVAEEPGDGSGETASSRASRPAPGSGSGATGAAAPGSGAVGHRHNVPGPVVAELTAAVGGPRGSRLAGRLADASHAYQRERYQEARKLLRPLAEEAPDAPAVRELLGLTLYRLGQWQAATKELEAYRQLTGSFDQHPVLADCYRALRRYGDAEALWDDLRTASPDADLVAEGRIVAAGCRADQGDLRGALALLERGNRNVEHPRDRHLRQWYVLADLYERAGELPRARELFGRVLGADPDAFDVRQRLRALR
jgi:thioredoxin-like negative regulator of GroEL